MPMCKLWVLSLVAVVGLGLGCGNKKGDGGSGGGGRKSAGNGEPTPAAAIQGVIDAMSAGNAAAAASYFPGDDVLASSLDCGPDGRIVADVKKARDGMEKDAAEIKSEGATLKFISATPTGPEKVFKKGETMDGCTAKVDITVVEVEFKFEMQKGDKKRERDKTKPVGKFGDSGWYVLED